MLKTFLILNPIIMYRFFVFYLLLFTSRCQAICLFVLVYKPWPIYLFINHTSCCDLKPAPTLKGECSRMWICYL